MVRISASNEAAGGEGPPMSAEGMRDLLESSLSDLSSDQGSGPVLSASGMRIRLELTDLGIHVDVAADPDSAEHHLRWDFADAAWEPKLSLRMDSTTANAYLQGRQSLAIAIARGRVRCRGESGAALVYLPLLQLLVEPYRRAVLERAPAFAV